MFGAMTPGTFPPDRGFRDGDIGTHTSRTMMLEEISVLFSSLPVNTPPEGYRTAIIEDNLLGKRTQSTRRLSFQRLRELYALDNKVPLFRLLRRLWDQDANGRPLLALLTALARDPLLRTTMDVIDELKEGDELSKQAMTDKLKEDTGGRLNPGILDKVVRNASASWTDSGHLRGRQRKFRQRVRPTPHVLAFALCLGHWQGKRGDALFRTLWMEPLDCPMSELYDLAQSARVLGLIGFTRSAEVVDVNLDELLNTRTHVPLG